MIKHWRRLWASSDLLYTWTAREFKVRYRGSSLGATWAILYPAAFLAILLVVFSWFLRVPTAGIPAPLFMYCGVAPWLASSATIQSSSFALVANIELVKNASFPREVLPLSTVLVGVVDFAISALLLVALLLFYKIPLALTILSLPLLFLVQMMLTLAICLFCAAWVVFYRDVRFLVPIALQFWMYLTPVFYPLDMVPQWARSWYLLNPMAALVDSYRRVLLFHQWPQAQPLLMAAGVSSAALAAGYAYFKSAEWEFADRN